MAMTEINQGFEIPCGYTNFEVKPSAHETGTGFHRFFGAMEPDEDSPIKVFAKPKANVIYTGPAPVAPIGRYGTIRSDPTSSKLTATGSQLGQGSSKPASQFGQANTFNIDGTSEGNAHANSSYGKDNLDIGYGIKETISGSSPTARKKNDKQIQYPPELLLMRPARQRIETFRRPYTRERFMEIVRRLYRVRPSEKPLFYLAAVDVTDPSKTVGFSVGEGVDVEEWDDQLAGLIPHIEGPGSMIRVLKLFVRSLLYLAGYCLTWSMQSSFTLRDGRNTLQHGSIDVAPNSVANRVAGLTRGLVFGTELQPAFNKALTELLASGPEPVAVERARLQVARYQGEWLEWYADMPINDFLFKLLWKVDDPVINVYPIEWVSHCSRKRGVVLLRPCRNPSYRLRKASPRASHWRTCHPTEKHNSCPKRLKSS